MIYLQEQFSSYSFEKLKKIENQLNKVGIILNEKEMTITIDDDLLNKVTSKNNRHAGRPKKDLIGGNNSLHFVKIREVYEMREIMTDKQVAEKLGISMPTFYRRLKKAETLQQDGGVDDALEWSF